jgi:hypothetical protein
MGDLTGLRAQHDYQIVAVEARLVKNLQRSGQARPRRHLRQIRRNTLPFAHPCEYIRS